MSLATRHSGCAVAVRSRPRHVLQHSTSERQYGGSAYAKNYVAVNGPAVTDFLRVLTGVPSTARARMRAESDHC